MQTRLKSFQDIWRGARGCPLGYSRQGVRQQDVLVVALLGSFPSKLHVDTLQWGVVLPDFCGAAFPIGISEVLIRQTFEELVPSHLETASCCGSSGPLHPTFKDPQSPSPDESYHAGSTSLSIRIILLEENFQFFACWNHRLLDLHCPERTQLCFVTIQQELNSQSLLVRKHRTCDSWDSESSELSILAIVKVQNSRSLPFWKRRTFNSWIRDPYYSESTKHSILTMRKAQYS